ncbi:MAG TPA: hypothetical protein DEO91_01855 [Pseudomonas sp.]|nr:hypothetical protein [Pseudomonas sp.]
MYWFGQTLGRRHAVIQWMCDVQARCSAAYLGWPDLGDDRAGAYDPRIHFIGLSLVHAVRRASAVVESRPRLQLLAP